MAHFIGGWDMRSMWKTLVRRHPFGLVLGPVLVALLALLPDQQDRALPGLLLLAAYWAVALPLVLLDRHLDRRSEVKTGD